MSHDLDNDPHGFCVVYPKFKDTLRFPQDAVAAFKVWDEAEAYQKEKYPEGCVFRQAVAGDFPNFRLRILEGGEAEYITHYCSYCGQTVDEVEMLIKAPEVGGICDECVAKCVKLIEKQKAEPS